MSETIAAVQTIGLTREYRRGKIPVSALNGIDLTIGKGEIFGVIGPSGSGKSTLLNLIGGLDRPSKGKVLVDDVDLGTLDDQRLTDYRLRKIGFIFQFYNLISTLSALENVEVPMGLADAPKAEQEERATRLLKAVGLEARVDHMPDELSGGEQQRVAVARALANNPSVILADEPTGDLDSRSAKALMDLIRSLQKERGVTFVLVTHDPLVVVGCNRTCSVRDGKITHVATKEENDKLAALDREMLDRLY
jgi:putative ABC transport system ATP-binding protein